MAINITDGFNLTYAVPIDYRMVVANSTDRTSIVYKYDGLKVFQQDNRQNYIWNSTTSTWTLDYPTMITGTGSLNYVPKVTGFSASTGGVITGNSVIYNTGTLVGINTNDPKSSLQVNPSAGQPITIGGREGTDTKISYNWWYNSGDAYFNSSIGAGQLSFGDNGEVKLRTRVPSGTFVDGISVLGSTVSIASTLKFTNLANTRIHSDGSTLHFYVYGNDALSLTDDGYVYANGGNGIYLSGNGDGVFVDSYSSTNVNIQRLTGGNTYIGGQTRLINGTTTAPALSFSASTNTGIFSPAVGQIAISANGVSMSMFTNKDFFANIHSTGGGTANHLNPSISSGTYSPVAVVISNCSSVTHPDLAYWCRVGNVVTVSGRVTVDPTNISVNTSFRLTIPISYNNMFGISSYAPFSGSWSDETWRLNGVGQTKNTALSGDTCSIEATVSASDVPYALFSFYATQTTSRVVHYTYQYVLGGGPYVIPGGGGGGGGA